MASNAILTTNVAPFIPEVWSLIVLAATENELVFANHVDRRFEKDLTYGDRVNIPNLSNLGNANAVNTSVDLTLYDDLQNTTTLIVNYHYYQAIGLGKMEQLQDRPDFLEAALQKCGYSVGKMMDDILADLVNSLTKSEGSEGNALTSDILINCYEDLNTNAVPADDRAWILDPKSITDLMKLDYFIRYDYVPEGVVSKGFTGRQIFGAPVYMTQNLNVINTSYHAAVYMHRQALALASQQTPQVFRFDWPQHFTPNVVGVDAIFGVVELRDTFGIWIKTRN